jgi:medium-chain acyl-[acyl-carrier-protein] hydrolase
MISIYSRRESSSPWLGYHRPSPQAKLRLFCFPYAGGGASIYREWARAFPSSVEICPVELPGRGGRLKQEPYIRISPLVEAAASGLLPYFDTPFAFFGHSMGAVVAFELARRLRRTAGYRPFHLFVSGRRAPNLPASSPPTYNLPEPEFLEQLRSLNGTPKEVLDHPELMSLLLPTLRADFELVQTYEYRIEPPLDIPMTAMGGVKDPEVDQEQLREWRRQTSANCALRLFPGDHFYLNTAQSMLIDEVLGVVLRAADALPRHRVI